MPHPDYTIRRLDIPDLAAYKAIRLEALQREPGMFGNSHALEAALPEADWTTRLSHPGHARFGLYHCAELMGITGIVREQENPKEAYMTQSYIRREHRGKGLSAMLYTARIEWARSQGIRRLIIGHRESNTASKAANSKFGFVYTHREPRRWPDGAQEDMLYYELLL